jgi:rhamnosyltransferase
MQNSILIISHYHEQGIIRTDTLKLIIMLKKIFKKIIFVSTKLKETAKITLPREVKVIIRKNVGKDFMSYRAGFLYLCKKKYFRSLCNIYFMNTSFVCLNPHKFKSNVILKKKTVNNNFIGLTKSFEINEHIQTYFFKISKNIFTQKFFLNWFYKMKPLKKRMNIIYKYEIGLSQFLMNHYYKCNSIFPNTKKKKLIVKIFNYSFFKKRFEKGNPTAFFWKKIYKNFGIIKTELIKKNPHNQNTSYLKKIFLKKKKLFNQIHSN